jgi:hypothetical protein
MNAEILPFAEICAGADPTVEAHPLKVSHKETEKERIKFQGKLEDCLKTNQEIGTPFARIIKKYPGSSKRGSQQQSHLKAHMSRS